MRHLIIASLVAAACCAADTPAATTAPAPAAAAAAFSDIELADLQALVAAKKVVLLDVNGSDSFKAGHIPGAIDFIAQQNDIAKVLPADKGALIVAYCGSPQCTAWKHGAEAVAKLGYTNVKHFKGGISGWKDAKAPIEN